jgi:hypothetical protein
MIAVLNDRFRLMLFRRGYYRQMLYNRLRMF